MDFRKIKKSDIDNCSLLFSKVFSSEPWNEPWTKELALDRISHFYESSGFFGIAAENNDIVGFALGNIEPFLYGSIFYLREMCVNIECQNNGIGSKILEKLELELQMLNVKGIYLATKNAIPASAFYQNNGFELSEGLGFYFKKCNS